jgi:AcrR family transcriptional regulator
LAGCSRVSFYQYFESKEDVFRHLAGTVARQLNASTDRLDEVTADEAGWTALREWAGRYAEIYARYEPVFRAFPAAAASDTALPADSMRAAHRYQAGIRSRIAAPTLSPRELDATIELSSAALPRTLHDLSLLTAAAPDAFGDSAVLDAYADMFHRSLFGLAADANVHTHAGRSRSRLPFGPVMQAAFAEDDPGTASAVGGPARVALLDAARQVFVERGFHGTRVDDVVERAGVSHGAFYRYFKNKDELGHLLAAQAVRTVASAFREIPSADADRNELRRWLRAYNRAQLSEAAMIRVWVDAALDTSMLGDSASVLDWGRRRMVMFLEPRHFGDPEIDAVVLLALVDAFGMRERSAADVDAAATIIERGFLGRA